MTTANSTSNKVNTTNDENEETDDEEEDEEDDEEDDNEATTTATTTIESYEMVISQWAIFTIIIATVLLTTAIFICCGALGYFIWRKWQDSNPPKMPEEFTPLLKTGRRV